MWSEPETSATFRKWGRWCDVHLQMNVSLKYTPLALIGSRAIVIQHSTPYLEHGAKTKLRARAKIYLANKFTGIACSDHIRRQVPKSVTILNPYDDGVFRCRADWSTRPGALAFLGRLVSDKGCDTLLDALVQLRTEGLTPQHDNYRRRRGKAEARTYGCSMGTRWPGGVHGPPHSAGDR